MTIPHAIPMLRRASIAATLLALSACHSEPPRPPTTADAPPTLAADLGAARNDSAALGEDSQGTPPLQPTCPAPKDLGVRLIGRYDGCNAAGPRLSWSGSGFVARLSGTGLNVTIDGPPVTFTTLIDGITRSEFTTTPGKAVYPVASALPSGEHVVLMSRQGEASFEAVTVTGGTLLVPPPALTRRIEILGDSITAGYGNEGTSPNCPFSPDTENHYVTYGALLAREFEAELSTVAWSGKGVVSNYGGDRNEPMPALYDRAEPNDPASLWDYMPWQADAVLVNLGTNDYSTDNDPRDEEFTGAYANLLATIRLRYPKAHILCTVGPLLDGTDLSKAESNIRTAVARRVTAGDHRVAFHAMHVANANPGCDGHPGLATHVAMANDIQLALKSTLGW
jgi:lysophospholipase L1-like esterase